LACSRLPPVIPDIKYATSGDLQIAYQVVGDGPVDVVLGFDWGSNIELVWEHPQTERFLRRVASYGRLLLFDMRGSGCRTLSRTCHRWRSGWTTSARCWVGSALSVRHWSGMVTPGSCACWSRPRIPTACRRWSP
jgi:pimeloyl-ACP methyl ester carboxylesterase